MGDVKMYRNLKAHPRSTREALSTRVPRRASENTPHCHVLKGSRDIKRVGRQAWEQDISEMLRRAETERFHRANRYYDALHRVGVLLKDVRLRSDKLQAMTEEMEASNEELQATNEEMETTNEELERASTYRQTLMDSMADILMTTDPQGVITEVNKATEHISGYSREELIGQPFRQFFTEPDRAQAGIEKVLAEGRVSEYELILVTKDERQVPVSYNATVLKDNGRVTGILGSARDITDRKRAEEALARSNEELQQFAYVASHDLQEPLRKIKAFGDRLQGKFSDTLGDEGRDYLERMQSATGRMHALINDLLAYSRVTREAKPFVTTDMKEVVQAVLTDLEVRIEESGAQVEVGDMPSVEADPMQMQLLMRNLIGNALKFQRPDEAPAIEVRSRSFKDTNGSPGGRLSLFHEISVQDNGVGFDEKYLDRIFTIFQRLHGRGEYEGSGIGLSLCRKIVERHGGRITAKSKPGEGSTFTVSLPAKQQRGEVSSEA